MLIIMPSSQKRKRTAESVESAETATFEQPPILPTSAGNAVESSQSSLDTEAVDLLMSAQNTVTVSSRTAAEAARGEDRDSADAQPTSEAIMHPPHLPLAITGGDVQPGGYLACCMAVRPHNILSAAAAARGEDVDAADVQHTSEATVNSPPLPLAISGGAGQPGGNRARFMAGLQPSKVSCDLTSAPTNPGMRFSFEAILLVVYPARLTPPERRYVELMDEYGTTGITVWNSYVHALKPTSVGCVVKFTRLSLTMHNGKKSLTMSKDSTMHLESPEHESQLTKWWSRLLMEPAITCAKFHDMSAGSVVNVSGTLGFISQDEKMVNGETKMLLILYITDKTGKLEIRSWNHADVEFMAFRERPVLFNRVRVCMYAGNRTAELLTGNNGTKITTNFDTGELETYWGE